MRNELAEVPARLAEVSEVMLTITRSSMRVAPARTRSRALPGGRALEVLGPVSEHASVPDDLPHPVSVLREVADVVREWMGERSVVDESLESATVFLSESARWIVAHEELAVWVEQRLAQVLGLLRVLAGDVERVEPRTIGVDEVEAHMRQRLREEPSRWRMTPSEADHFWPGIAARIKAHRSRAKARARAESRRLSEEQGVRVDVEPELFAVPDAAGRYGADELAQFHRVRGHVRAGTRREFAQ